MNDVGWSDTKLNELPDKFRTFILPNGRTYVPSGLVVDVNNAIQGHVMTCLYGGIWLIL